MGNRKGNKTRLYLSAKRKRNHFCRKRQIPVARNSIVGTKMSIPEETAMGDAQSVFIKIEMDVEDTLSKHLEMLEQEKQRNDEDLTQLHTEENIDLEIKQEFQITDVQPTYKEVTVHDKNNLLVEKSSTKQKVVQEMVVLPENVMTEIKTENIPEGNGEFSQNPQEMVHQAMVAFGFPPYDTIVAEGAALANVEACLEDIKSEDTEYEYTTCNDYLTMESGFVRGQSDNLPKVHMAMVLDFLANNPLYTSAEIRGVKLSASGRESYGDDAIGYVQVRREGKKCTVKARITPEHKVRSKPYHCTFVSDEETEQIISVCCEDCAASRGGCKHAMALVMWLNRRFEEPSCTSVKCYCEKSKLSTIGSELKFIKTLDLVTPISKKAKAPKMDLHPSNVSLFESQNEIPEIKEEPEFNVTETHLISNKLINTTSTITRPHDGVTESTTTSTLVMQILPMGEGTSMEMNMATEEILPNDSFQLNSITGDELSLEQLHDPNILKTKLKKEKTVPCPKCTNMYLNKRSLKNHLAVHDSIERFEKGRESRREKLEQKNKLKKEPNTETEVKSNAYKCTCGKTFRRGILMEACMKSHDFVERSEHYCTACDKEFESKDALILHRKRLHLRKKFPCKFCPTEYMTQKELFKHLQLHQKVQLTEYKVISGVVDGTEELKCFICGKKSAELPELKTHVLDGHTPPYICKCNKKISKLLDYVSHFKSHSDNSDAVLDALEAFSRLAEDWKCEECNVQFAAADSLAVHRLEKHTLESKSVEETLQCEDCRRAFASAKSLNSHRRVHHSTPAVEPEQTEESLKFLCVYCRKVCKDENALTSHLRLHSPERKFVCKFCDFRFATAEKRKSHAEIHTGDLKFVCFICEYQCSSLQRLSNHKKTPKHLGMKDYLLTGVLPEWMKEVKKEPKTPEPKKRKSSKEKEEVASCDICGDVFPSESVMLEHKQTHPFISFVNETEPTRIFFK